MKLKPFFDKIETRKIVLQSTDNESMLSNALVLAMEFELLYLKNKCEFYQRMEMEDRERIKMLEERYSFAKNELLRK